MSIIEPEFMALTENLDLEGFWEEDGQCQAFTTQKPRCPLSFAPDDHWLFEFFGIPSTLRYYQDKPFRDGLHRDANRLTLQYIGQTFFDEDSWQNSPRRIENLYGSEFAYHEGSTPWFVPVTDDPEVFSRILDQVEKVDLKTWAFPEPFLTEWELRQKTGRSCPPLGTGSRGPATVMTSILKPETVFYWIYDRPALMQRFRDSLAEKMIALAQAQRQFSGTTTPGWWITDDNCALFNRQLYRDYCAPVLEKVLQVFAPGDAPRYQHSDSAMGHLLEIQYGLGIRTVNYGPEVDAAFIRSKMPAAYIHGQIPPMLLRNGSPEEIRDRVLSDFHKAGQSGGLKITTAGSLSAGTGLGRMRWLMKVVQDECRYDRGIPSNLQTVYNV